jgi:branched-chain amino acid aminotransferase
MEQFLIYNGSIISTKEPVLTVNNRAFKYGDGIFESLRSFSGKFCFFYNHLKRLRAGGEVLKFKDIYKYSEEKFLAEIFQLKVANNIAGDVRVKITIFRKDGGLYGPLENNTDYMIEIFPLDLPAFELNKKGLIVNYFPDLKKPHNKLSNIKSCNALYAVLASEFALSCGLDDVILLNDSGRIAEASASNIFLVKNNVFYTPLDTEACVAGTMREVICSILKTSELEVKENLLTKEDVANADEIFFTNAIKGVQWVERVGDKKYVKQHSERLLSQLNELVLKS